MTYRYDTGWPSVAARDVWMRGAITRIVRN